MDSDTNRTLTKILGKRDIDKIPSDILRKVERFCETRHEEFTTTKVLYCTAQKNIEKLRKDFEKLSSRTQDSEVKIEAAKTNVTELRNQLESANSEIARLTQSLLQQESETNAYRKERNEVIDSKDQLLKSLDSQNATINRLQSDLQMSEGLLKSTVSEKCDAIARLAEFAAKEQSIEFREKRMEKENDRLNAEIVNLTENLNKNMTELFALRHNNTSTTAQMEINLIQKIQDLEAANLTISHLTETNHSLTIQLDRDAVKLKDMISESAQLVEHYKQELNAKIKLADLYKQNCDEFEAQTNELTVVVADLHRIINETNEKYELLETKFNAQVTQNHMDLQKKEETIIKLTEELKAVNAQISSLDVDNAEKVLEKLFPRAAEANRLLSGNLSLTDFYGRYHNSIDNFHQKEEECLQLKIKLENVALEYQERISEFENQQIEYRKIVSASEELTQSMNDVVKERDSLKTELEEASSKLVRFEQYNKRLKLSQTDLARQICNLLNKIQASTDEKISDPDQFIRLGVSNSVISKKLVTFDNIVEMQENNQNLLLKVTELSAKLNEMEAFKNKIGMHGYEGKIANYEKRMCDAERSRQANEDLLEMCLKQKERYKELYYEAMKDLCKQPVNESIIATEGDALITGIPQTVTTSGKEKKVLEVEQMLQEKIKELKTLKEEFNEYRKENSVNFNLLSEQYEAMESKVRELNSVNCRLSTQANFTSDHNKSYRKDLVIYKKQIESLEERNHIYDETIKKHETANKNLRDETMNIVKKLSAFENRCEHLERECRRLIEVNSTLEMEHQAIHRQKLTNSILESNLELMKISTERLEFEGRIQMEQQLEECTRQYKALNQKLEEEQNRFTEELASLKRQTESAVKKSSDDHAQTESIRSKLSQAREQIESKNQQISNLSKKLQEALTPCKSDNPIAKANKRIKDLDLQVKSKVAEIEKLKLELKTNDKKIKELTDVVANGEDKSRTMKQEVDTYKAKITSELQVARLNETNLKSQVEELQQEIRLQITGHLKSSNPVTQNKVQTELKEALQKITDNNRELRDLRLQCHKLKESLHTIENKYSNEMKAHSSDLQALTSCKDELNNLQKEIDRFQSAKDDAVQTLKSSQLEWEATESKVHEEIIELKKKLDDLEKQNQILHDLLQAQIDKNSSFSTLNDSIANNSILNRTMADEELKEFSAAKLFSVIKFLRREKDISITQIEILKTENTRLLNEFELQQKRVTELNLQLATATAPVNEPNVVSGAQYAEIMRKVETLNAMTDSNIRLRAEKDALINNVKNLTERISELEKELSPLQEKNRELTTKNEDYTKINNMLKANVDVLRKRASDLIDKNPDDFKRLQNERENLAKMLTTSNEKFRQLNDELSSLKAAKALVDQDLIVKSKHLQATADERKKSQDDLNNFKQINVRLAQEITDLKGIIARKQDELKVVQNDLSSKDAQLTDSKSKEIQIRRIAKKYKDSFVELKTKEDEREASKTLDTATATTSGRSVAEIKTTQDWAKQLASCQEEMNQLRKDNESLKMRDENDLEIIASTETNRQMTQSSKLQPREQDSLKSQFEVQIKELLDHDALRQEIIARLTRENETLNTRVNQLQRQFQQHGSKPSTSSGTIEKSSSDLARTANVKPMATPSTQQSTTVNLRRGGETPLASIRPMSVQNSRTAAILPTSQTTNIVAIQGSSTGALTTALVPPQQQVHTTGNLSTAEAMSSSPTSSYTDYMPATSSAAIVAIPPMSTSAESTQDAESLSVNTNESSSSSTSSQAVLQQQTVALVSPRVEVTPQNIQVPSQQVVDQNQAASTSGSSSSFLTAMSSHHQASSSNTVTTTQAGGHKRPRDAEGDSSTGVEESSASEKTSPQNKRTRLGEQTFQGVTESGIDVEYQVPTSSQRDQEDDVVAVDSEDEDDEVTVDVDEAFDAENGDTDEIESFGQDEVEGHDIDEDNVPNDTNEVDVDDSSDAPNLSSSGVTASSGARPSDVIVVPLRQETQQIQMISSGSDAGPSGQVTTWRQVQTPTRQQQNLVIQQAYEEAADDSIVPSTPTLYVARRVDGSSEAVSSPHPIVPHASRFIFSELGSSVANSSRTSEGMDETRMDLNILDEPVHGDSTVSNAQESSGHHQMAVVVHLDDSNVNKQANQKEPIAGPSSQRQDTMPQIIDTNLHTYDDSASTSHVAETKNDNIKTNVADESDIGTDGVSSEGEKSSTQPGIQVEEGREAEASVLPSDNALRYTRSRRMRSRGMALENQRPNQIGNWNQMGRYHPMPHHQQQHGNPHRGSHNRGPLNRGLRGRPRRPYR